MAMAMRLNRFVIVAMGLLLSSQAGASPISEFSVGGAVAAPRSLTVEDLQALPQTTQTLSFLAGGGVRTDTFTGPKLWDVLGSAGGITVDTTTRNGLLRNYVVAEGGDGYRAVISVGEIAPSFGNKPFQVAIDAASGTLPDPDGFARVTAAGDVRGGRYVRNLAELHVGLAPLQPGTGGGRSTQIDVRGLVALPWTLDLAALQGFTPHTQTVTYLAGSNSVTNTFTGALLWDVLTSAEPILDPSVSSDLLRKGVIATGSDGYQAMFSLGELSPTFGNAAALVAYADEAGTLEGDAGFARIVVPGDVRGGRFVSNLVRLTVFDATLVSVPEPTSLLLLLSGLVGVGVVGRVAFRA